MIFPELEPIDSDEIMKDTNDILAHVGLHISMGSLSSMNEYKPFRDYYQGVDGLRWLWRNRVEPYVFPWRWFHRREYRRLGLAIQQELIGAVLDAGSESAGG